VSRLCRSTCQAVMVSSRIKLYIPWFSHAVTGASRSADARVIVHSDPLSCLLQPCFSDNDSHQLRVCMVDINRAAPCAASDVGATQQAVVASMFAGQHLSCQHSRASSSPARTDEGEHQLPAGMRGVVKHGCQCRAVAEAAASADEAESAQVEAGFTGTGARRNHSIVTLQSPSANRQRAHTTIEDAQHVR